MQNNTWSSTFGQFSGVISLISSILAGFFLLLSCITFNISLIIAIPFGLGVIFFGLLGIILGKIGVSLAKKNNSPLLIPKTGLMFGNIVISVVFIGFFLLLFEMAFDLMH